MQLVKEVSHLEFTHKINQLNITGRLISFQELLQKKIGLKFLKDLFKG